METAVGFISEVAGMALVFFMVVFLGLSAILLAIRLIGLPHLC